jgi:hypothetical protein
MSGSSTLSDEGGRDHCKNPKRPRSGSVDEGLHSERGPWLAPVDVAILFAGAARTALVPGANLTLTSADATGAAEILRARAVVPLHFEG